MLTAITMAITLTLTGSNWVSTGNEKQTLAFDGSRVTGNAGCNRFTGSFAQDGADITLSDIASTRKACAPDIMIRERQWLAMLDRTRQVDVSGDILLLKDETGTIIGRLMRQGRG
jgi:heat shock protein HslJ